MTESGEGKNAQMHVVRKQVQSLLGSAQKGEVKLMKEFLDTFAESHLAEESKNGILGNSTIQLSKTKQ
jgi:hypothetical protein